MASPLLTDKQLAKEYGIRPSGQPLDCPSELGYICPKGHGGDYLSWSEFKEHIWCWECMIDYLYADCMLKRMCWMSDKQWEDFLSDLDEKPQIIEGIQHFPDCKIPHQERRNRCGVQ